LGILLKLVLIVASFFFGIVYYNPMTPTTVAFLKSQNKNTSLPKGARGAFNINCLDISSNGYFKYCPPLPDTVIILTYKPRALRSVIIVTL